jgi:hypothetical protein
VRPGFVVWVTGPDAASLAAVAEEIAHELEARHLAVERFDERTPGIGALAGGGRERRLAFVASALARHGVVSVVAFGGTSRAGRDAARADIGAMIEVHVQAPDKTPAIGYEPPERAEVEILLPEPAPGAGVARTLRTLEVLAFLAPAGEGAYSEEEEREVIRRLKAFGYL